MKLELQWKMLDNYKRKNFLKNELKKKLLKTLLKNNKLPNSYRYLALWNFSKITRISSKTLHQNRCIVSGRNWYVLKNSFYSRFVLRNQVNFGNMPGFKRASW